MMFEKKIIRIGREVDYDVFLLVTCAVVSVVALGTDGLGCTGVLW